MPPRGRGRNKEQFVTAGKDLLYSMGYTATGVQDIADEAGAPKGSFYNYFKSKEHFAVDVINAYADETVDLLQSYLRAGSDSPLSRMRRMLSDWAENMFSEFKGCGCLIGNITQEMGNHSELIKSETEKNFARLEAEFVACLSDAKELGELPDDIDAQVLGAFIYNGWQGALVRSKSEGNSEQLEGYVSFLFDHVIPSLNGHKE